MRREMAREQGNIRNYCVSLTIDAPQEGATADACTLFELFEAKLEAMRGNLVQAAVDLAKG